MFDISTIEHRGKDIYLARLNQEISRETIQALMDWTIEQATVDPHNLLLIEIPEGLPNQLDLADLKALAAYAKENGRRQAPLALVTGEDTGRYFLAKLYVELVGLLRPKREEVFKTNKDALDWLVPPDH